MGPRELFEDPSGNPWAELWSLGISWAFFKRLQLPFRNAGGEAPKEPLLDELLGKPCENYRALLK